MFERFTKAARRVVSAAVEHSQERSRTRSGLNTC